MEQLTDKSKMPFGKYKDLEMQEVPANYLIWLGSALAKQEQIIGKSKAVFDYIEYNLEALRQEVKDQGGEV